MSMNSDEFAKFFVQENSRMLQNEMDIAQLREDHAEAFQALDDAVSQVPELDGLKDYFLGDLTYAARTDAPVYLSIHHDMAQDVLHKSQEPDMHQDELLSGPRRYMQLNEALSGKKGDREKVACCIQSMQNNMPNDPVARYAALKMISIVAPQVNPLFEKFKTFMDEKVDRLLPPTEDKISITSAETGFSAADRKAIASLVHAVAATDSTLKEVADSKGFWDHMGVSAAAAERSFSENGILTAAIRAEDHGLVLKGHRFEVKSPHA